jgi:hypothetical protein
VNVEHARGAVFVLDLFGLYSVSAYTSRAQQTCIKTAERKRADALVSYLHVIVDMAASCVHAPLRAHSSSSTGQNLRLAQLRPVSGLIRKEIHRCLTQNSSQTIDYTGLPSSTYREDFGWEDSARTGGRGRKAAVNAAVYEVRKQYCIFPG